MMYRHVTRLYRLIDRVVLRRGPVALERTVKSTAFRIAKFAFPSRISCATTELYLSQALAHRLERRNSNGSVNGQVPQPLSGVRSTTGMSAEERIELENAGVWVPPALPSWAASEIEEIAATLDPGFHADGPITPHLQYYAMPLQHHYPGIVYSRLRRQVTGKIDVVILVPWLKQGGADLGAIHFATALHGTFGKKVLVIGTEAADSPWASRLPEGVQFLDAGTEMGPLSADERRLVMVRLMLQLAPQTIHLMNSYLGWQMVAMHTKALRHTTKIYASLYCDDVSEGGHLMGYAQTFLMDCYEALDGVISDNGVVGAEWARSMGISPSLFHVVPFPVREPAQPLLPAHPAARTLLWAGRLDRQKRPDVLLAIARAMPEWTFDVYGQAVMDQESPAMAGLRNAPNVRLRGAFNDFYAIVRPDHLALVYTTQWDGMPNILLEAARAGLPIVAPAVGGIVEFIPSNTLVADPENVAAYVEQIKRLADERDLRNARVIALAQQVKAGHSPDAFTAAIQGVPGYLGENVALVAKEHATEGCAAVARA
ncbi:glycosyltransferase family 4 protein [Massilia suwonensis]|uniref:Glycosyltransferase family 4 protein n=1 Tax=Massilia suwonensis TaxID=648895 RepID=A0ABW0MRP6_9BURK